MYENFYLSDDKIKKINNFLQKENILFITGNSGCGKSTLAKEIFKNISITIDSSSIKKYKNIKEDFFDKINKKNIMMMFSNKKEDKEILIDDFDVIMKYDKKLFSELIIFLSGEDFFNCKFIICSNNNILSNRKIKKIKYIHIDLSYTLSNFYKIVKNILNKKKIKKSSDEIDKIIYLSKYNLNTIYSNLEYSKNIEIKNDNFDTIENIQGDIIKKKYNIKDLLRLCETNENIISLNLLENSDKIIDKKDYFKNLAYIYSNFVYSDIIDTFSILYHNYDFKKYIVSSSIYVYCIYKRLNINNINLIYNKYICRSIMVVNIINNSKSEETELIYKYLYYIKKNQNKDYYINNIKNMKCKNLKNIINLFEKYENYKINIKELQ
jgi:energy-coupling factor transporter ATP-binding protein EcfA2